MLRELHISNLAVIADATIELSEGLNCFTGATGAGKSLVIGALEVLLGLRSPVDMLRHGASEGRITGLFHVRDDHLLKSLDTITDQNISQDSGEILLARKLYASGRSAVSVNGHPITLSMLKQVAEHLVDVHGQHDHQYLLRPSNQLDVLDQYGDLHRLRQQYHDVYQRLVEARCLLEESAAGRSLRQEKLELARFQAAEIDAAELNADEFNQLEARSSVLQNLERLKSEAGAAHQALYEADGSVLERLKGIAGAISDLSALDPALSSVAQQIRDATLGLEESALDISRYLSHLDLDPAELTEVNDRLNIINRVLSKYGPTIDVALEKRAALTHQIGELESLTEDLASLRKKIEPLEKELRKLGRELTVKRTDIAGRLGPQIEASLADLGMEKARFSISLAISEPLPSGLDLVEFVAQTNPGQPAQPLRKIASGGELSRIMLALKGILAGSDRISVLVFDEIDANVGGRLGAIIGAKLRALANHHQVLCITHLPQIASFADRHLTVRKGVVGDTTVTTVRPVDGEERLTELSEMIGGHKITDVTRAQAAELLEAGQRTSAGALEQRTNPRRKKAAAT